MRFRSLAFTVTLVAGAMLFSGCSAKERVSFSLFVLTVFSAPLVLAQAIIGAPAVRGQPIDSPVWRAFAIILYLVAMGGAFTFLWGGTEEMLRLSRESRLSLVGDYLLLLLPVVASASMFGRVWDASSRRFDVNGDPLPPRRGFTFVWAFLTVGCGVGLPCYVFI